MGLQDLYREQDSVLHQMDARVKVVFTLGFILALSLAPSGAWPAYILFLSLAISGGLLSRLGIGFVQKRSLLALPFTLAALPLVFMGPPPVIDVPVLSTLHIPLSPAGLTRFASIALKSWISVQAAVLLAACTPFPALLGAFRHLKIPWLLVAVIAVMWRYLFTIGDEAARMMRARNSRSAILPGGRRPGGSLFWRARVTGGMAGSLFLRSLERSERVYAAMLSRGYNGEPPAFSGAPLSTRERGVMAAGLAVLAVLLLTAVLTGG